MINGTCYFLNLTFKPLDHPVPSVERVSSYRNDAILTFKKKWLIWWSRLATGCFETKFAQVNGRRRGTFQGMEETSNWTRPMYVTWRHVMNVWLSAKDLWIVRSVIITWIVAEVLHHAGDIWNKNADMYVWAVTWYRC